MTPRPRLCLGRAQTQPGPRGPRFSVAKPRGSAPENVRTCGDIRVCRGWPSGPAQDGGGAWQEMQPPRSRRPRSRTAGHLVRAHHPLRPCRPCSRGPHLSSSRRFAVRSRCRMLVPGPAARFPLTDARAWPGVGSKRTPLREGCAPGTPTSGGRASESDSFL